MIESINLVPRNYIFSEKKLNNLKRDNYIYGKNGTGKSSLVKLMEDQYSSQYDLRIFQGFESIIGENKSLNAIVLGTENTQIQKQIDKIDIEIKPLSEAVSSDRPGNLKSKVDSAYETLQQSKKDLEKYYTDAARKLTEKFGLGRKYNKVNFKNDMPTASPLSSIEIKELKTTRSSTKIIHQDLINFPKMNLELLNANASKILSKKITPKTILTELENNPKKRNFAYEGMHIHNRIAEERCAFCGNVISDHRWNELDEYFSKEIESLNDQIFSQTEKISKLLKTVDEINLLDKNTFYDHLKNNVAQLNGDIEAKRREILLFLTTLIHDLQKKKTNIFELLNLTSETIPSNFDNIQVRCKNLVNANKQFSNSLETEKAKATQKLMSNEIFRILNSQDYKDIYDKQSKNQQSYNLIKSQYDKTKGHLEEQLAKRKNLSLKTTDQIQAASLINKLLCDLGNENFLLDLESGPEEQNGSYFVKDHDGNKRNIRTLSTGEKNILAFLYFIYSLDNLEMATDKEKIVILDDPMTSNDDNTQYLMISIIERIRETPNHSQFFLLTHNTFFYIQSRPGHPKYQNNTQNFLHLRKTNKTKVVHITSKDQDIENVYDELWLELRFAYDNNKPIFMWNIMRRIIEAYNMFVYGESSPRKIANQVTDIPDKLFALSLIKSLNVNSHIGYEPDVDISTKNKDDLKNLLQNIFEKIGAKGHFLKHWQS